MVISYNWLKELIAIDWSAQELAKRLTMAGIEIDRVTEEDGDFILEADLTPNRGDILGMVNVAHEVAGLSGAALTLPQANVQENDEKIEDYIHVTIEEPDLCARYTARLIKNVKIGPSPEWMQTKLLHSGIRPINNVVDITNYVMLETNQPLHAFDYDFLKTKQIIVRRAKNGEKFTTLDGVERALDPNDLVISDGPDCAVALAGVMGGLDSEIHDDTVNVLLESAVFNGYNVRKTSRRLALRSESSIRYEKGCDVHHADYVSNRAAGLLQELAGGEVVGGIFDAYPRKKENVTVKIRPARVNQLLGLQLSDEEITVCLERLGMTVTPTEGGYSVQVPSWRADIEMEVDLIEEVARIYGYDRIPATLPSGKTTVGQLTPWQSFVDQVREYMSQSMLETINYSFIHPKSWDDLRLTPDSPYRNCVQIANPLSEEQSVMRTMLLPGLLNAAARNLARQNESVLLYEIGRVFYPTQEENVVREKVSLGGVIAGKLGANWLKLDGTLDFYFLKGVLDVLFAHLGVEITYEPTGAYPSLHPGRSAQLCAEGKILGVIGEIHPHVQKNFGLKDRVCVFELNLENLFALYNNRTTTQRFSRFPMVSRDLAVLVKEDMEVGRILNRVRQLDLPYLIQSRVFDVYVGEQVETGQKSVALNFVFQAPDRTLTDTEIAEYMQQIVVELQKTLHATVR